MKVVINRCYGGFGLSDKATQRYGELKGLKLVWEKSDCGYNDYYIGEISNDTYFSCYDIKRVDPILIQVVEELGAEADGQYAELAIIEIPDDVEWGIEEYDGREWVAEKHRTWY